METRLLRILFPSIFTNVCMEPVTLYGCMVSYITGLNRKYNKEVKQEVKQEVSRKYHLCGLWKVIVSLCRYLIPHNFKSRHYDDTGREVVTKVSVPMLIYV